MAKDRRDRLTRELPLAPQKQPPPARSGSSQIDDDDKPKPKRKPTHHQTMSETRMLKMATMAAQAAGAQFATQEQFAELRRTVAKYGLVVEDVRRACRPNAYDTRPPSFGWVVRRAIEFADQRWRRKEKQREGRHGNY